MSKYKPKAVSINVGQVVVSSVDGKTEVYIDGKKIDNVVCLDVHFKLDELPTVNLKVIA